VKLEEAPACQPMDLPRAASSVGPWCGCILAGEQVPWRSGDAAQDLAEKTVSQRPSEFVEHLSEAFRLFGPIRHRRMFGGYGIYYQDMMIGLVADDTLYLKTDAETVPVFQAAGSRPFEYRKNGVVMKMSYWLAPVEVLDEPETASRWARLACEAALRSRSRAGVSATLRSRGVA
jgi:DNA transformation protein and related proteins